MKKLFVFSFVLTVYATLTASVVSAQDVFTGTWKANIAKSQFSPGPPPKVPGTTKIERTSDAIKYVVDGVNDKGQKTLIEFTVKFDGKDYPMHAMVDGKPDTNGPDTVSFVKIGDYTLEQTEKKNGQVTRNLRHVYSKDGKTRTVTFTGKTAQGQPFKNVVVYEKQ